MGGWEDGVLLSRFCCSRHVKLDRALGDLFSFDQTGVFELAGRCLRHFSYRDRADRESWLGDLAL